jgi:hypothetical protein
LECRREELTGWLEGFILPRLLELARVENWSEFDKIASGLSEYGPAQREGAAYLLALDTPKQLVSFPEVGEDIRATCLAWLVGSVRLELIVGQILSRGVSVCLENKEASVNFWWWLVADQLKRRKIRTAKSLRNVIEDKVYNPREVTGVLEILNGVVEDFTYAREHFRVDALKEALNLRS